MITFSRQVQYHTILLLERPLILFSIGQLWACWPLGIAAPWFAGLLGVLLVLVFLVLLVAILGPAIPGAVFLWIDALQIAIFVRLIFGIGLALLPLLSL